MTEYPEECQQMQEKCIGCEDMTNRKNEWFATKFDELRTEYENKCANPKCSETKNLEFAHKQKTKLEGMGRGRKERYYDIVNNPRCYVLLCNKCHDELDKVKELTAVKL